MSQEDVFDAFYRSTRSDILIQTFLLTGDLPAAAAAVKDSYAITWQHWKKVVPRGEPIEYVRPLAYRLAQRRHAGRIWHRNKGLTEEHKQVLDAVHKLGGQERRVLLLVDVGGVEPATAARELALTPETAAPKLATARAELTAALGTAYLDRLLALGQQARATKLPRLPIILRSGRERRRLQAIIAVAGAAALTVGVGAAATEPGQERASAIHRVFPGSQPVGDKLPDGIELTTPAQLLEPFQLAQLTPGQTWTTQRTDNNTRGDGINTICQPTRYADPHGLAALLRTYESTGKPSRTALQTVEISRDENAAETAYETTVRWFAGCQAARLQMLSSYEVTGVGDQAELLRVQVVGGQAESYDVAVARIQEITTTVVVRTTGESSARPSDLADTLGDAVSRLCPGGVSGGCVTGAKAVAVPPPPSGEERGFVATVDLPPAGPIRQPWVGVPSVNAMRQPDEGTRCDRANFSKAGATSARARTFLIPQADVPTTFGFTETYGEFRTEKAATAFLDGVRRSVAGCEERDLTAEVVFTHTKGALSAWRFETKVSDELTVAFRVGFVHVGKRVAKLTFVPDGRNDMTPQAFTQLVRRAGERLGELR